MKKRVFKRVSGSRLIWVYQRFALANRPLTTLELAMEYEVSSRTIRRDIELLRDLGCDLVAVHKNNHGCEGLQLVTHPICPFCKRIPR